MTAIALPAFLVSQLIKGQDHRNSIGRIGSLQDNESIFVFVGINGPLCKSKTDMLLQFIPLFDEPSYLR